MSPSVPCSSTSTEPNASPTAIGGREATPPATPRPRSPGGPHRTAPLRSRCGELAQAALLAGDEPFGPGLVDEHGTERFADRNRVAGGDATRHPEFAIARWAAANLTVEERADATVYTSGEHCPMCAAAH